MLVARFIHTDLERNQLPTHWTYPEAGIYQGAQVLPLDEALEMAVTGEHADDFFVSGLYAHLAILEVTATSGERGPLTYSAVLPPDVTSMRVIELADATFGWAMMEIALELADAGHDIDFDEMGLPKQGWYDDHLEEVIGLLLDEMTEVTPTWVDTLEGR